jgi:hypothetical protein
VIQQLMRNASGYVETYFLDRHVASCTVTIYVKDRKHPVTITEFYAECHRNTQPWNQYPRRMLRHKTIMQCARIAFGLGGIYDEDEARDIVSNEAPVTSTGIKSLEEKFKPADTAQAKQKVAEAGGNERTHDTAEAKADEPAAGSAEEAEQTWKWLRTRIKEGAPEALASS